MDSNSRPSTGSRPSSITRSHRDSFVSTFETLPPENGMHSELNEEVQDDRGNIHHVGVEEQEQMKEEDEGDIGITNGSDETVESVMDKKIRKGFEKIVKLDNILSKKVKREKEVKKERRTFEKEFYMQIQSLIAEKGAENICGSQQLLSLCNSSDGNSHADDEHYESIFTTQIDAEFYKENQQSDTKNVSDKNIKPKNKSPKKNPKAGVKTDFVNRNIELASHANENILLTEDEKLRLTELLADDSDLLLVENPFSSRLFTSNNAYSYSEEETKSIGNIDARLKELIPEHEHELVGLTHDCGDERTTLSRDSEKKSEPTASASAMQLNENEVECGEKILQNKKEQRNIEQRLKDIEHELASLQLVEMDDLVPIDPDLLSRLIDSDSRLTSSAKTICESISSKSDLFMIEGNGEVIEV